MPEITTSWGLSFTPGVSSSKNRKSPALAAGIGASSRRLFSRLVLKPGPSFRPPHVDGNKGGEVQEKFRTWVRSSKLRCGGVLSDVDVGVGVLARFESVLDSLESLTELRHVGSYPAGIFFSLHDYSGHEICDFHHVRFFHPEPCDLGDACSYSTWSLEVSSRFDVVRQQVSVKDDIRILELLLDRLAISILCNVCHEQVRLREPFLFS